MILDVSPYYKLRKWSATLAVYFFKVLSPDRVLSEELRRSLHFVFTLRRQIFSPLHIAFIHSTFISFKGVCILFVTFWSPSVCGDISAQSRRISVHLRSASFNTISNSNNSTMSIPGMPPFGTPGAGGNPQMEGLSEKEQAMVKMVSALFSFFSFLARACYVLAVQFLLTEIS